MRSLTILYEDQEFLAVHKPAGVAVQSKRLREPDMVSLVKNYLFQAAQKNGTPLTKEPYVGVIHRLDQPVEGILLFAKTKQAAAQLSSQITQNKMKKEYLCVAEGNFFLSSEKEGKGISELLLEGTLEDFLLKNQKENTSSVVSETTKDAKKAILHYQVLETKEEKNLVKIRLVTGRHHQIRVQMAHHGTPLLGDLKYNPKGSKVRGTIALCAFHLELFHPKTKKPMSFEIKPNNPAFAIFHQE